jgi:hypothetical protein
VLIVGIDIFSQRQNTEVAYRSLTEKFIILKNQRKDLDLFRGFTGNQQNGFHECTNEV